jgi:hypothetical protein
MADYSAYTQSVIDAIGKNAAPRVKKAFPIMIRKLHEAVRMTLITLHPAVSADCCQRSLFVLLIRWHGRL